MRFALYVLVATQLLIPRVSDAQTTGGGPTGSRFFIDLDLPGSAFSSAKPREFTSRFVIFGEAAVKRASYPKPERRYEPGVGGGVLFTKDFGLSLGYTRTVREDVVGLFATIPHPTYLGVPASASSATDHALKREESAAHLSIVLVSLGTQRLQLRLVGGPSYFFYKADMVDDVIYAQSYDPVAPTNSITVNGFTSRQIKGRRLGMHLGADFAYFVTRRIGVSGGIRFSTGIVTVAREPLSTISQEIRVGGRRLFLGVHLRLGS